MKEVNCPVCGTKLDQGILDQSKRNVDACSNCGYWKVY